MRDSALKRILLAGWFSGLEVWGAFRGMRGQPNGQLMAPDYDEYWRQRHAGSVQPRFELIAKYLEPEATVLDVGCGDGALLEYLASTKRICGGVGLDISEVAVQLARKRGVDARCETLAAFYREVGPGRFDHVIMSEVLEHVSEAETLVVQGWDLTRKTLWLTFPNIAYFPHRLRLLVGKFPVQWAVFPGEHLRFWSIPDFRHWLQRLGMPRPKVYPSNGIILFALHRAWPNLLANQVVVRLEKP